MLPSILIIDDTYAESANSEACKKFFALRGIRERSDDDNSNHLGLVEFCSGLDEAGNFNVSTALSAVTRGWDNKKPETRWALVIVDYNFALPGGGRIQGGPIIVEEIRKVSADIPIVLFSSSDPGKVEADVKYGMAFLKKPTGRDLKACSPSRVELRNFHRLLVQHGLFPDGRVQYVDSGGNVKVVPSERKEMKGGSLRHLKTLRHARASVLNNRLPALLIVGAEGSGKDELVRFVHDWGRAVALAQADASEEGNVVSLRAGEMIESELARLSVDELQQKLESAKRGTLHVDLVECLPAPMQRFFTRWIEERITGTVARSASQPFQLIFTSSHPTQDLLERGQIVSSLADLLDVIEVPGVFDRQGALELLEHFLKEPSGSRATPQPSPGSKEVSGLDEQPALELTNEAREVVAEERTWPGNVRQIRRLATLLAARNEFRQTITADEIRACMAKTSSGRPLGARRGVRGLIDRIASQEVGESERLNGVLGELQAAVAKLFYRIIDMEAVNNQHELQPTMNVLFDERARDHSNAPKQALRRWIKFLEIGAEMGGRINQMFKKPKLEKGRKIE